MRQLDGIQIYSPAEFNFPAAIEAAGPLKRQAGNRKNVGLTYINAIVTFDIETSRLPDIEQSFMYIWQMCFNGDVIVGRTWREFQYVVELINGRLSRGQKLLIFVHNLSYEFQFLAGIFRFDRDHVFALKSRKVLKCEYGRIEFRCSYIHSNMSLDEYTRKMGAAHAKLTDDEQIDYSVIRYPWTYIEDDDLRYCVHDVLGLYEAIKIELEHDGDDLYTFPLTSTGYVRRDVKRALNAYCRLEVPKMLPDYECYKALREAFRGGDTHANRYYAGIVLENVRHVDRASSYPDVQINCKFPSERFVKAVNPARGVEFAKRHKRAYLVRIMFTGLRLLDKFNGCPYLSISKCRNLEGCIPDNGRVLEADRVETTVTDIDMIIIEHEYVWDSIEYIDCWHAKYKRLPQMMLDVELEYFRRKTELKGVEGAEVLYMKSKNKLNSIYGMSAENPVKQDTIFTDSEFVELEEDEEVLLAERYERPFLPYQWGVWTTALARLRLREAIWECGRNFIYCDTDSIFYLGNVDFSAYNEERIVTSTKNGGYADDPAGNRHYLGVFEDEGDCDKFVTFGAKKYAYEQNDKLQITIAGVPKKAGSKELAARGGIYALCEGFTFESGGNEICYNDLAYGEYVTECGKILNITRNAVIRESTYTLGVTADYKKLLCMSQKMLTSGDIVL